MVIHLQSQSRRQYPATISARRSRAATRPAQKRVNAALVPRSFGYRPYATTAVTHRHANHQRGSLERVLARACSRAACLYSAFCASPSSPCAARSGHRPLRQVLRALGSPWKRQRRRRRANPRCRLGTGRVMSRRARRAHGSCMTLRSTQQRWCAARVAVRAAASSTCADAAPFPRFLARSWERGSRPPPLKRRCCPCLLPEWSACRRPRLTTQRAARTWDQA